MGQKESSGFGGSLLSCSKIKAALDVRAALAEGSSLQGHLPSLLPPWCDGDVCVAGHDSPVGIWG